MSHFRAAASTNALFVRSRSPSSVLLEHDDVKEPRQQGRTRCLVVHDCGREGNRSIILNAFVNQTEPDIVRRFPEQEASLSRVSLQWSTRADCSWSLCCRLRVNRAAMVHHMLFRYAHLGLQHG
eukprot:488635-Amphidinium_carterae.2